MPEFTILPSGRKTFTILPRGRKTLKERLINLVVNFNEPPADIWAEALKRLEVTQADLSEMTEEESAAFNAKVNAIVGDILSGLTLKQVLKLVVSEEHSPKDGDTLRQPMKAFYEMRKAPHGGGGGSGAANQ